MLDAKILKLNQQAKSLMETMNLKCEKKTTNFNLFLVIKESNIFNVIKI